MASLPQPYLTVSDYIELERKLGEKFEYLDGQVYAMSGASTPHVFIQANLVRHLGNLLSGSGCKVLGSDLHVHVEASGLYAHPDATVICGPPVADKIHGITNPKILIEVLSPSSRRYDQVGKFGLYRAIPSLEEYVLVEQDRHSVDCHRRTTDGHWELTRYVGETAALVLRSVNVTLPLALIYEDVPFAAAERETEQP